MPASNVQQIQPIPISSRSQDEDEIDLADLIANLSAHKWTIAIIAAVIFSIAAIYAFTATPIYRAVALAEVEEKKEGIPGLGDLSDMFGGGPSGKKEVILIKSYMILGETVDRLNLNVGITPSFFPLIGSGMFHRYKGDGLA